MIEIGNIQFQILPIGRIVAGRAFGAETTAMGILVAGTTLRMCHGAKFHEGVIPVDSFRILFSGVAFVARNGCMLPLQFEPRRSVIERLLFP